MRCKFGVMQRHVWCLRCITSSLTHHNINESVILCSYISVRKHKLITHMQTFEIDVFKAWG